MWSQKTGLFIPIAIREKCDLLLFVLALGTYYFRLINIITRWDNLTP